MSVFVMNQMFDKRAELMENTNVNGNFVFKSSCQCDYLGIIF